MADRNSIIDKIKALLAKTTANGATEAEMMSALDKASAMMDAYDISDDELKVAKDEAAMLHADPPDLSDPHKIKWQISHGVAQFCGVEIYRSRRETGLKCIGMPSDVQFAMWLLDSIADFVFAELYTHLIGCLAPKSERRIIIRSFTAACCDRITGRLLALVERSKTARTSNGRELVVIKNAAIKDFMKEHGIHLRTCGSCSPSNVNTAAQAAGRAAGDRASFGRPVSGAAGVLRIGR
jgi:Cu/Zn superoxide dismutase